MSVRAAVRTFCPARAMLPLSRPALSRHSFPMVQSDAYATSAGKTIPVKIVEVGPRDGLQNEKAVIPPEVKVGLINRLAQAGATVIEAGSFVSPKWVPQVCSTSPPTRSMYLRSGLDGWHGRGGDFYGEAPRRHVPSARAKRKRPRECPQSPRCAPGQPPSRRDRRLHGRH